MKDNTSNTNNASSTLSSCILVDFLPVGEGCVADERE